MIWVIACRRGTSSIGAEAEPAVRRLPNAPPVWAFNGVAGSQRGAIYVNGGDGNKLLKLRESKVGYTPATCPAD